MQYKDVERESGREREREHEEERTGSAAESWLLPNNLFHKTMAAYDCRMRGTKKVLGEGDFCHLQGFSSPYTCIIEVPHGQTASTAQEFNNNNNMTTTSAPRLSRRMVVILPLNLCAITYSTSVMWISAPHVSTARARTCSTLL